MKILTILQASCSIPIIFPPIKIGDDLFIDGCTKCIDGVCSKFINNDKINFIIKGSYNYKEIKTLTEYICEIINCTMQNEEILETDFTINVKSLEEFKNKFNFNDINQTDKIRLYYHGINEAKKKIENNITNIKLKINDEILENLKNEKMIKDQINKDQISINEEEEKKNIQQNTKEEINIKEEINTKEEIITKEEINTKEEIITKEEKYTNDNVEYKLNYNNKYTQTENY